MAKNKKGTKDAPMTSINGTKDAPPAEDKKETFQLNAKQQAIVKQEGTTSDRIRGLLASGMTRSQVAKALDKRYQHVRNVELQPLKKSD
jgi:hypothetical protein